jgi:hypothetical protein
MDQGAFLAEYIPWYSSLQLQTINLNLKVVANYIVLLKVPYQ